MPSTVYFSNNPICVGRGSWDSDFELAVEFSRDLISCYVSPRNKPFQKYDVYLVRSINSICWTFFKP